MALEVDFHPLADLDLEDIYNYIAKDSPDRAIAFIRRIQMLCSSLVIMPERGRSRSDLAPGVRTLVFERRAIIAYRLQPEGVVILRIFYAGQNFDEAEWPHV